MRTRYAALCVVASLFCASMAWANGAVTQSGPVTSGHVGSWQQNGVVQDGGGVNNPAVNALGLYDGSQCPFGVSSNTSPGYQSGQYAQFSFCQSGTTSTFKFYGINGAPTPGVYFDLGGVLYPFPIAGSAPVAVEPSIHDFTQAHLGNYAKVLLSAYGNGSILVGDGGQGSFTLVTSCVDDGGVTCAHDADGHAYARDNPDGDVRQGGITKGSPYDCSPTIDGGMGATACSDSTTILAAVQAGTISVGLSRFYLAGQIVRVGPASGGFTVSPNMVFDLGGVPADGRGAVIDGPGTIYTADHFSLVNNGAVIQNGTIAPAWYPQTYPSGPSGISQLYAVRNTMIAKGDTGISCAVSGCGFNNITVAGYDDAMNITAPGADMSSVSVDGNIGIWIHATGSNTRWTDMRADAIMTKGSAPNEYFSVASVVDNGTSDHLCRITLRSNLTFTGNTHATTTIDGIADTSPLQSGMPISGTDIPGGATIANIVDDNTITISIAATGSHTGSTFTATYPVGDVADGMTVWSSGYDSTSGGINAWGRWVETLVSSGVVDLQGSYCNGSNLAGPDFTAQWTANSMQLTNVSSVTNLRQGMTLSDDGGFIGSNVHIRAIWATKNIVLLDKATAADSGGAQTVHSLGGTYSYVADCNTIGQNEPCFILSAAGRYGCGTSAACTASGGIATAFLCGGPTDDDRVSGLLVDQVSAFSHETGWQISNCRHLHVNHFSFDATRKLKDDNAGFMLVSGDTRSVVFSDGAAQKSGFGITVNADDVDAFDKGCIIFNNTHVGTYELDQGCFMSINQYGDSDYALIANAISMARFSGDLDNAKYFYEGATAQSLTDTNGGVHSLGQGASWWGGHFEPGGASPASLSAGTGGSFVSGSNDTTGTINIGTGSPTDIGFNFASNTWAQTPNCSAKDASDQTVTIFTISESSSAVAFVSSLPLPANALIQYLCTGISQ